MFATISSYVGAGAFALLAILLTMARQTRPIGRLLLLVTVVSSIWLVLQGVYYQRLVDPNVTLLIIRFVEFARDACWLIFLAELLKGLDDPRFQNRLRLGVHAVLVVLAVGSVNTLLPGVFSDAPRALRHTYLVAGLVTALAVLVLIEQIFRNAARDSRWALKHLCFGAGVIFAYDFYLYADAVLFGRVEFGTWVARSTVNACAVPMIAISAARNRAWELRLFVSRKVVMHTFALAATGCYLLAMAGAGYYLRAVGGQWGQVLSVAFMSAAALLLMTLFYSDQVRSRMRDFLARHFYQNKYEYGEEWLRFTQALASTAFKPQSLTQTMLVAVGDIVDSPGGVMWRKLGAGNFVAAAQFGMYEGCRTEIPAGAPLIDAVERASSAWDLSERGDPEILAGIPEWLLELPQVALLVPIVHGHELLAFVALARSRSGAEFNAEDINLLGTVGCQAASYLALLRATDELSEVRQFETFNRLSAFLVHDLKNVVAQLSLISSNARRHRGNPEFVEDAFNTIEDAVGKMNRMLTALRQKHAAAVEDGIVDVREIVCEVLARHANGRPCPVAERIDHPMLVRGGQDVLLSVVEHLVQNAIEATAEDGQVVISAASVNGQVSVTIADTGCGMDRDFINNRLFKPFDTTKGKAGMGIGAYESRHLVLGLGGQLRVDSEPGRGTSFTISLPAAEAVAPLARTKWSRAANEQT